MHATRAHIEKFVDPAQRIRAIQKGEPIPKRAIEEVTARWSQEVTRKFEERKSIRSEDRKHRDKLTARLQDIFGKDKEVVEAQKGLRALATRLAERKPKLPSGMEMQPKIMGGSVLSVFAPPYDTIWAQNLGSATTNQSSEDDLGGTFGFNVTADGSAYAAAAIGTFCRPVSNNPVGHFRPFMRCSYSYLDSAWLASTAHNDGYLHARVVSMDSKFNIVKWPPDDASFPLWSDGVSVWDDTHSVDVEDDWPGQLDVQFELAPDHIYLLWCWCECSLDDGSASFASSAMSVRVPFMVVQETNV
ncbi:MAG TPA: hypothetical protein VK473_14400 [Terriglobales bacterium]|nr:hypothetical protein [Terriglobales bacterium]